MRYIKGLDTLRAFAVVDVLLNHWTKELARDLPFRILFPNPRFGVDLFFVISGFLITNILLEARDSGEGRADILKTFFVRRTLRIFPVYYATMAVFLLIGFPFIGDHKIWFLTYTPNILAFVEQRHNPLFPTWSLAVEEQFYLLWPWLIVFVRPRYLKYVFYLAIGTGVALTILFRLRMVNGHADDYSTFLMPLCLHAFGIGGLYAWLRRKGGEKRFVRVITLLLPIALLWHFYWTASSDGGHFNYFFRIADCVISIWLIHKVITIRDGWIRSNIVENPVAMAIGRVSYGIYLFHFGLPAIYEMAVRRFIGVDTSTGIFLMQHWVSTAICLLFLCVLVVASYKYFEKPILGLKRYFQYRKKQESPYAKGLTSPDGP